MKYCLKITPVPLIKGGTYQVQLGICSFREGKTPLLDLDKV